VNVAPGLAKKVTIALCPLQTEVADTPEIAAEKGANETPLYIVEVAGATFIVETVESATLPPSVILINDACELVFVA
jgi:hypothetical protein